MASPAEELEQYQFQLAQVDAALLADPLNADLKTLRSDLLELVELTAALLGVTPSTTTTPSVDVDVVSSQSLDEPPRHVPSTHTTATISASYGVGDTILAKWSVNNKWYEAAVTAVSTRNAARADDILYSVVFAGYQSVELVRQHDTRPFDAEVLRAEREKDAAAKRKHAAPVGNNPTPGFTGAFGTQRPTGQYAASGGRSAAHSGNKGTKAAAGTAPSMFGPAATVMGPGTSALKPPRASSSTTSATTTTKKDPTVKAAKRAAKLEQVDAVHRASQQSWQQFASKKKAAVPGARGSSIFATPDNPLARVGVTGSGRGMTENKDRGKHRFEPY
ncbi:hypothetical protein BC828DRAFT_375192 [Blastocladiella britannica]|nr:hypothetical protein BC828DRAFT_375192 [Blastocladiella britannica]